MHWLAHLLGLDSSTDAPYLFWSGPGACLAYLGIFGTLWRRHVCHVRRCHRIGRHPIDGTPYVVCAVHHDQVPNKGPRTEDLRA